ncbi:hypothetical protein [Limosilactobacillus difficilis]|uniref:hypothetical protein n=1 Tax=Limosilactobacillus difficilis TaxID=2991838 RepID=UPI0024BA571F|nr:hypothetical protein [Limosilactobacillus difficilis]
MNNLVTVLNMGAKDALAAMTLGLLKTREMKDDAGETTGYRAEVVVLSDSTRYVKSDGEVVDGPNALTTFSVRVLNSNVPKAGKLVQGVKLINPRFTSLFGSSQPGSTFATIHASLVCDEIQLPGGFSGKEVGTHGKPQGH